MSEFTQQPPSSTPRDVSTGQKKLTVPGAPSQHTPFEQEAFRGRAERFRPLSPLGIAIVRAFGQPDFAPVLARLIVKGGDQGIQRLWAAAQEILERGQDNRRAIAWVVASEISKSCGHRQTLVEAQPSLDVVARYVTSEIEDPFAALKFFRKKFPIDHLQLVLRRDVMRQASGEFFRAYLKEHYDELVQDPQRRNDLGLLLQTMALRRETTGLEICRYIRERYESVRGWSGKEAEAALLWRIRDDLTQKLYDSPLACERNLKLALLYPRSVPHPCLDFEAQRMLDCERWILDSPSLIQDLYGWEHALKIFRESASQDLLSTSLATNSATGSAPLRGLQAGQSKFDMDSQVLFPLYGFVGLSRDGMPVTNQEVPARSWLSRADEVRAQKTKIVAAFKTLAESYWGADSPERVRERGRGFIRAVVRNFPYAVADAAFACRRLNPYFLRDLLKIVREEALHSVRSSDSSESSGERLREIFVVSAGFGISVNQLNGAALRELDRKLAIAGEKELSDYESNAFLSATRMMCSITPALEARAVELVRDYPDTLGASLLARMLFEVRCSDPAIRALVLSQAMKTKLGAQVWLNYAHAAIGFGFDRIQQQELRELFKQRYEGSIRGFAGWCPRARTSLRLILGALSPELIGDVRFFNSEDQGLFRSPLEARVVKRLEQVSGISIKQDVYLPWAPAVDGIMLFEGAPRRPIAVLIDGENYHSVNNNWMFRGFDGHSLLVTRILTQAGYPVVRIAAQFGEAALESALTEAVSSIARCIATGEFPVADRLVVDPQEDFKDIGGKVILYRPVGEPRELGLSGMDLSGPVSSPGDLESNVEERSESGEAL